MNKINTGMIQTIFGSTVVFLKTNNVEDLFSDELYQETVNYLLDSNNLCSTDDSITSTKFKLKS
jgi:hypothetical protein